MTAEPGRPEEPVASFAHLDIDRESRTGVPEVIYGHGKTCVQTLRLLKELRCRRPAAPALATRCPAEVLAAAPAYFVGEQVSVDEMAGTVTVGSLPAPAGKTIVVTAGTSDLPVALECMASLAAFGVGADLVPDVGVAGLHRLLSHTETLRSAHCVIVVAGMDGALPSVVAGLVAVPVVGVPTSIGYGVGAEGLAAVLSMLASCSPGLAVVNIDNGFGAAAYAAKTVRLAIHG